MLIRRTLANKFSLAGWLVAVGLLGWATLESSAFRSLSHPSLTSHVVGAGCSEDTWNHCCVFAQRFPCSNPSYPQSPLLCASPPVICHADYVWTDWCSGFSGQTQGAECIPSTDQKPRCVRGEITVNWKHCKLTGNATPADCPAGLERCEFVLMDGQQTICRCESGSTACELQPLLKCT